MPSVCFCITKIGFCVSWHIIKKLSKPKTTKIFNTPLFIRFYDYIIKSVRDLLRICLLSVVIHPSLSKEKCKKLFVSQSGFFNKTEAEI